MKKFFTQFDTGLKVDGDYTPARQLSRLCELLAELLESTRAFATFPAASTLKEGRIMRAAGFTLSWWEGWRERAVSVLRANTAPGLLWEWNYRDLYLIDTEGDDWPPTSLLDRDA